MLSTIFQQEEGPYRGLLRDCENLALVRLQLYCMVSWCPRLGMLIAPSDYIFISLIRLSLRLHTSHQHRDMAAQQSVTILLVITLFAGGPNKNSWR